MNLHPDNSITQAWSVAFHTTCCLALVTKQPRAPTRDAGANQ